MWGYADSVVSRACDNAVRRLRERIEGDPARPDHVLTVHGTGYRFEPLEPVAVSVEAYARPAFRLGSTWIELGRRRVVRPDGEEDQRAMLLRLADYARAYPDPD